ncbi:MAG: ATP synthase subunit I [Acidobacteria bacterium]|nr:ATP synthase subunit I [Pyrinomonadaceae bacterium]MCC6451724.1 ATP synthase subunit I [Acidobacteriota bacterium]
MDVQTDPESGIREYSQTRIYGLMAVAVAIAAIAGLIFANVRFSIGVVIGGLLSVVNFIWLASSTRGLFAERAEGRGAGFPAARFILRYFALGLVIWGIYAIKILPIAAVLIGLAAFAVAVMTDGFYSIFKSRN